MPQLGYMLPEYNKVRRIRKTAVQEMIVSVVDICGNVKAKYFSNVLST